MRGLAAVKMLSREFLVAEAVQHKACPEKVVLWNGANNSGTVEQNVL